MPSYFFITIKNLQINIKYVYIYQQRYMNRYKSPYYVTPRLAIFLVSPKSNVNVIQLQLKERHSRYFHIFNLTNLNFSSYNIYVPHTNFKWRDVPYSITQAIRILTQIDTYLRSNSANSAIICVQTQQSYRYALYIIQSYLDLLSVNQIKPISDKIYSLQEFSHIYSNISIKNPPIKIIQSIEFDNPDASFVPVFQIFTETRYNHFQSVYFHKIQEDLTEYYVRKNAPLSTGIGKKYYDQKPQTKFLKVPVLVYGDVKIVFYSYEKLVLTQQFICGFNTKALAYEQTVVSLEKGDLYEGQLQGNKVHITLSDYCKKCEQKSECKDCVELTKKVIPRYTQAQVQLEKLHRERKGKDVKNLLSL